MKDDMKLAAKLIDKTEIGALKQWLRDNIEYEDYCIKHNLSKAAHAQRMCWYSVLEYLGRGDE